MQALIHEIKAWGKVYGKQGRNDEIPTIYFGGGTPSVLSAIDIEQILQTVRENFTVQNQAEITIECNPGTVDAVKFSSYYNMGINRISMGLQSSWNEELKMLGRIHTYEEFLQCYQDARQSGFANISMDIMSGLPGQTIDRYRTTLERVVKLEPQHISSYSLIIEEGTPFYRAYEAGRLELPDEDTDREMYELTNEVLQKHGYHRYEISNYAREGYEARHNSSYWKRANYLGMGLGASSMMDNVRFKNTSIMKEYIYLEKEPVRIERQEEVEVLSLQDQMSEFMFLGLRMMQGISPEEFEALYHENFEHVFGPECKKLEKEGLLCREGGRIRLTKRGIDVSNVVFSEFI